ncbi:PREDICTED: 15-hydroxyprostaglandin dehydrogenase [NAD(+)]-like [Priapulus caudatus]|uniref:15-hydroxyprostaglandin dehydrogenase [NAD(+)] n=1 Tax=Priapulus caudatus TaxID=37621 RepID=A0ABM1F606_PRICU|nr:PREDICTED: 15-hydroxyprostaglandin dehydrogenase [NAD(+)]-like [Priapulus caudatus]
MKVEGKVAMVTGGARGIGKAICAGLLEEGAKGVCIVDNRTAEGQGTASELCAKHGENRAIYVNTDVTADDQFEAAFVKTKDQYGRLDIVINNAAIVDLVNYRRMVDVNLTAVITGTMLALKYMGKCHGFDGGIVVNVSSIGGLAAIANLLFRF